MSLLTHHSNPDPKVTGPFEEIFLGFAEGLVEQSAQSAYRLSLDHFAWGSNSDVANPRE
jgi:hypothetical protein